MLFDDDLVSSLAAYRRFRHVATHTYGFQLDWDRMMEGIRGVGSVFAQVEQNLSIYLGSIAE
jgi:hypothetical protein